MDATWARVSDLFHRLVDLDPAERARILDEECADESAIRSEVERLIAADASAASAAASGVSDVVAQAMGALDVLPHPRPGDRLGPYELMETIGAGGMGTVYLARRADEAYRGTVAIKILTDIADPDWAARMRDERHILASLTHPGIARLIDGGETPEGQPYLVMEHVDGVPLDVHAASHDLLIEDRLRLFLQVCDAVDYAHGRLVVHRDLKPANILVDGEGRPRLLDFGIATLLDAGEGREARTRTGLRPMTPRYASPEQVRGERVTTATDVYSLGVILYQQLTGSFPLPPAARTPREIESAILDAEPEPPSRRAASSPDAGSATGIAPDLDTIVLKALAKEPARRYASVQALADDLERYLDGAPVLARPSTWTYRASKFARRNRGAVLGGATTLLALIAFAVSSGLRLVDLRAERLAAEVSRDESEAVTSFLVDVFAATDPNLAQGLDLTAGDVLARAHARVIDEFSDRPRIHSAVVEALGRAYERLGAPDSAAALLSEVEDLRRRLDARP